MTKHFTRRIELYISQEESDQLNRMCSSLKCTTSNLVRALLTVAYARFQHGTKLCDAGTHCPYDKPINLFSITQEPTTHETIH